MNKLTKVGCSALCGSLAAISSASAGELTVTGGADLTWFSHGEATTGNPVGMASAVTFKGSGELDNGWTFNLTIAEGDASAYSATTIDMTMGGFGTIEFDQGNSGNGIAAYDNVMPTAWEEAHGAGLSGGVKTVLGASTSNNVQYTTPTMAGTTLALTYAREQGTSDEADKVATAGEDSRDSAYDITLKVNPSLGTEIMSGLNFYFGASVIEANLNGTQEDDAYEGVGAITYALGPVEIGAMWSGLYDGQEDTSASYHTYKNHAFGIAFNVNDDLSVSYGQYESRKAGIAHTDQTNGTGANGFNVSAKVTSWQAAYTLGGASVRVADVKADNVSFLYGDDQSATIVSMSLAF